MTQSSAASDGARLMPAAWRGLALAEVPGGGITSGADGGTNHRKTAIHLAGDLDWTRSGARVQPDADDRERQED